MALLGMNTYIYAPKDDLKHRMHWRDLYTVDEAGITFLSVMNSSMITTVCFIFMTVMIIFFSFIINKCVMPVDDG